MALQKCLRQTISKGSVGDFIGRKLQPHAPCFTLTWNIFNKLEVKIKRPYCLSMCFLSCIVNAYCLYAKQIYREGYQWGHLLFLSLYPEKCPLRGNRRKVITPTDHRTWPSRALTFPSPTESLLSDWVPRRPRQWHQNRGQSHFNSSTREYKHCLCAHMGIPNATKRMGKNPSIYPAF